MPLYLKVVQQYYLKENFDFFSGDYSLRTYSSKNLHPTVSMLAEQGYSVQAGRCRPVEVDPDHPVGLNPVSLIYSSSKSWAVSGWANRKSPPDKNPLLDVQGPIPIASVSSPKIIGRALSFAKDGESLDILLKQ